MTEPRKDTDKSKETPATAEAGPLPVGHPQAGYVSPDIFKERGSAETLPPEEEEYLDKMDEERDKEARAVVENERKVVKEEQEERDKQTEQRGKDAEEKRKAAAAKSEVVK